MLEGIVQIGLGVDQGVVPDQSLGPFATGGCLLELDLELTDLRLRDCAGPGRCLARPVGMD